MDKTQSINLADSLHLLMKESGSTSRVDNPSDSISECFIDVTLPHELIIEILVRLPVKSLLRFKCVSKPWLSLISDPQFIRSHFSKSTSVEAGYLNLEILFATKTGMKKCCLYSALHKADPSIHFAGNGFLAENRFPIVGIINGLVCLNLKGTDLCLWNPALNRIMHFNFYPEPPSGLRRLREYCYSFGYDESNDDYKVICLQTLAGTYNFGKKVHIYSLKDDSWKRIAELKGFFLHNFGVFANGKIYWCGDRFATPNTKNVSLDMSSEKFVELQAPKYDAGECLLKMGVSRGRPIVLCAYYKEMKVDLWVLDKCGVEESWCKLVTFPYTVLGDNVLGYNYQVLCISRNAEIVLGDKHGLIVYNWKKKESRKIKLVVDITSNWKIAAYVESLVWPNYA